MTLTPEQRTAQLNAWREQYLAANPNLTPEQRQTVMTLDQLPGMGDYVVETTLMKSDYSRQANAAREAQRIADEARQQAEQRTQEVNNWYTQNAGTVNQMSQQLITTQAALRSIATDYRIPPEELQNYYGSSAQQPGFQTPNPAPYGGAPQYNNGYAPQQQPPASSQQYQQPYGGQQPPAPRTPQQPAQQFDPQGFQREVIGGVVDSIGEVTSVQARHFELTGKMLDASAVMNYMKQQQATQPGITFEQAWRQSQNITAIEQTRAAEAAAANEERIRADERAKFANQQAPTTATPQFAEARVLGALGLNGGSGVAEGEQAGHHGRTQAATQAYINRQQQRAGAQQG